jgi:hypothetical protein
LLNYLPYSPDLPPCNYHLFVPLRDTLNGHHFANDVERKKWSMRGLSLNQKYFFFCGQIETCGRLD